MLLLGTFLCQVSEKESRRKWWCSVMLVQKPDHTVTLKHVFGARKLCVHKCAKKATGRQHSNGKVIAFKYQEL